MHTFVEIIDCWPSLQEFADDIGVQYVTAQLMRHRNSVAAKHWKAVVDSAAERGITGVTLDALARIAATEVPRKRPAKRKREFQPAA